MFDVSRAYCGSGVITMRNFSKTRCSVFLIFSTIIVFSQATLAHSEKEKARFVAEAGVDSGNCNNRFRPCETIRYAVQQANKGDKILVASGNYEIKEEGDLLYLLSDMQPVLGGFSTLDNYQIQQPSQFESVLIGVPPEYVSALYNKGFKVIVDAKGINRESLNLSLQAIEQMQTSQAMSPCTAGRSAGFECNNISLIGHVPLNALPTNSSEANDIWGHVDLNDMREYAIIGLRRGVAVVDVTEPSNPQVIGSVSGNSTTWRDIKVYQYYSTAQQRWKAYAYVGADSVNEGLVILDLTNLPNEVQVAARYSKDNQAHNVYISNVDYTTNTALPGQSPLIHVTGGRIDASNADGAWRTLDLKNPLSPSATYQLAGATRDLDYTHDASSVLIDDERAQRDCVNAGTGSCNLILDFNENELRLWDHSVSTQATELGSETYPNAVYVHSGWWSEDKQYVILHDELDESRRNLNTTVHFFDISDLNNPTLVASWTGPTRAIDHNGFTRGNRYYMSNYERGVTILDISDPTAPQEAGFFDTFGTSNNASFNGTWGVYPYLPSGIILASDIQGGLYILKDETLSDVENAVGFEQSQLSFDEGTTNNIMVSKQGNGAMSVDYHVIGGSARTNDYSITEGTLSWSNGDVEAKSIEVEINSDNADEATEVFFVRLSNPSNGALKIDSTTAFVSINGSGLVRGVVGFTETAASVKEIDGTVTFEVIRSGGSDDSININYAVTGGDASQGQDLNLSSGVLSWANGDTESKFVSVDILNDSDTESTESFTLTLSASNSNLLSDANTLTVSIRDDESNQAPTANAGADRQVNTRQTVTLAGSATDAESDVTIAWSQTAGTSVSLSNADMTNASFTAPNSAGELTFEMTVTDDFGVATSDAVTVVVNASPPATAPVSNQSSSGGSINITLLLGLLGISAWRRRRSA